MTNKTLYELSNEYQSIMNKIEECDELTPEFLAEIDISHDSLENKILNKTSIVKIFESKANEIGTAIKSMEDRKLSYEKKVEKLKEEIKFHMEACKLERAENAYHLVAIRLNNPKVSEKIDINVLPQKYFKEKINITIDKLNILKDLKQGIDVPGACMVRETRLEIK